MESNGCTSHGRTSNITFIGGKIALPLKGDLKKMAGFQLISRRLRWASKLGRMHVRSCNTRLDGDEI